MDDAVKNRVSSCHTSCEDGKQTDAWNSLPNLLEGKELIPYQKPRYKRGYDHVEHQSNMSSALSHLSIIRSSTFAS